jgi:hypothetical protein
MSNANERWIVGLGFDRWPHRELVLWVSRPSSDDYTGLMLRRSKDLATRYHLRKDAMCDLGWALQLADERMSVRGRRQCIRRIIVRMWGATP